MKVGDLIKLSKGFKREACECEYGLEVVEDLGDTVKVRCVTNKSDFISTRSPYTTVRKSSHYVFKTLLERLEENDLNPVLGK